MSDRWRLLPYDVGPSDRHFAHSDALARLVTVPTVWWHSTERPTLILGSGQSWDQVDWEACQAAGVLVVKRQAGGAAVYARPGVLGLDVALPAGHPLVLPDVVESYRWLGEVWLETLVELGVEGHLVDVEEARAQRPGAYDAITRLACFGRLSPFEVTVQGRKLVGLAQVRRGSRALLQVGLHLDFDAESLSRLLGFGDRPGAALALSQAAIGMNEVARGEVRDREVMATFARTIEASLGVQLDPGDWTEAERQHADHIQTTRSPSQLGPGPR